MQFSLSKKLFIFICTILLLTIVPLFYIAETALSRLGSYAFNENKAQISNTSHHYLAFIADEMAQKHNEIFKKIKAVSSTMAEHITEGYSHLDAMPIKKSKGNDLTWNHKNQMFFSPKNEDVIIAYWGGKNISDKIQAELNIVSHFKPTLIKSKGLLKESLAAHIITISGIGCYYTSNINAKEACFNLPPPSEFDLRDGEPLTIFTKNNSKLYSTEWTNIYKDDVIDGLMMTATTPIYDQTGTLRAITGIDIPVDHIANSLIKNELFPVDSDQSNSFGFIQDAKGNFIAFPKEFFALFGLDINFDTLKYSNNIFNYSLKDSSIESVRKVASKIHADTSDVIELMIHNEKYMLFVGHLQSVHWQIVLVVKEDDILTSVHRTSLALKKEQKLIWKDFAIHSFSVLLIVIVSIIYAIRLFISPIRKFIETTQKVAKGDFSHTIKIHRSDEIGTLSKSINSMVDDLVISNKKVHHKTIQLKKLNENLLNVGEFERKSIASDLHDSVAQTLGFTIFTLKNMKESDLPLSREDITLIEKRIQQVNNEVRSIIYQLRPPVIDDFEIDIALGYLIEGYNKKHACQIDFKNESDDLFQTPDVIKLALYRATNELIVNILKHSQQRKAKISLSNKEDSILLMIEDNGVGFDLNQIKQSSLNTFGLYNISEQIKNLDGRFEIISKPGVGTKITICVPLFLH